MKLDRPVITPDRKSFGYTHVLLQPYGGLDAVIDWCKDTIEDDWQWNLVEISSSSRPGMYMFYFSSERDYLLFSLKWSG